MAAIQWDNSLSVNVAEIDQQHQKFISIVNDLSESLRQDKGPDYTRKIVNELIEYAKVHFKTEEKYFDQFGYPDADNHKKDHGAFIFRVAEMKSRIDEEEGILSFELLKFVSHWVLSHIKSIDKKYSQFLNDNGLE